MPTSTPGRCVFIVLENAHMSRQHNFLPIPSLSHRLEKIPWPKVGSKWWKESDVVGGFQMARGSASLARSLSGKPLQRCLWQAKAFDDFPRARESRMTPLPSTGWLGAEISPNWRCQKGRNSNISVRVGKDKPQTWHGSCLMSFLSSIPGNWALDTEIELRCRKIKHMSRLASGLIDPAPHCLVFSQESRWPQCRRRELKKGWGWRTRCGLSKVLKSMILGCPLSVVLAKQDTCFGVTVSGSMFLFCPQPNTLARLRAPLSLPPSSRECFSVHNNRGDVNTGRHLASGPLLMTVCSLVFVTIFACIHRYTGTQMAVTSDIGLDVQSVHTRAFWKKRWRNCPCNLSWPLEGGHATYHQLRSANGSQLHSLTLYLLVPKTGQTLET